VARAAGAPLPTRRDEDGLLAVELSAPLPSVELEHRPGPVEWAGVAVSLGALLLLGAWWRQVQRA
jgi:hypothetical protein